MAERQGVEIDFCPRCRGVWLDRGELDKILEREAALDAGRSGPRGNRHRDDDDDDRYSRRRSFWREMFD
jgi:Zn-finger nucleic acid-binding protein